MNENSEEIDLVIEDLSMEQNQSSKITVSTVFTVGSSSCDPK